MPPAQVPSENSVDLLLPDGMFPPEKESQMRTLKQVLVAVASALVVLALVPVLTSYIRVVQAGAGCTNASLNGAYALAINGFVTGQTPPQLIDAFYPIAVSGTLTFDGNGNVSRAFVFSFGGLPSPVADSGTYRVQSNCTAAASFPATGETFDLVVVDKRTATFVNATSGASGAGTLMKQRPDEDN